jgi:transcriptional regulator with XRE-family HTH domain
MRNACRVAEEVYRIRTEHKLSQKKTAELFEVRPSFISRLEDGDHTCLHQSLELLHKMAKHFSAKINLNLLPEESKESK